MAEQLAGSLKMLRSSLDSHLADRAIAVACGLHLTNAKRPAGSGLMKTHVVFALALAAAAAAHARPLIIEESARVVTPAPDQMFASEVGLDGDDAFATTWTAEYGDPEDPYDDVATIGVWLIRKVGNTWTPVRKLTEVNNYYYLWPFGIDVRNGVAAFALNPLVIFEKRNGDWLPAQGNLSGMGGPGDSVSVDGPRILVGASDGQFAGSLLEKDAAGKWHLTHTLPGEYRGGDDENRGRDVALSGSRAAVYSPYTEEPRGYETPNITMFRNVAGTWQQEFVVQNS